MFLVIYIVDLVMSLIAEGGWENGIQIYDELATMATTKKKKKEKRKEKENVPLKV